MSCGDKVADFVTALEIENPESAIVFCNTREQTKRLASVLQEKGYSADWLNADLSQADREKVMSATRQGDLRFLVATDVAARGIDISHLTHVINFDLPESPEVYVHRTGRTGRAGRTGTAISMVAPADVGNLYMLRLAYKIKPIEKPLPSEQEARTRAETDVVSSLAELFARRHPETDDLSLARRLLTHARAEVIVAGLLRDHLGDRTAATEKASAARRARAPRPTSVAPASTQAEGTGRVRKTRRTSTAEASRETEAGSEAQPDPAPRHRRSRTSRAAADTKPYHTAPARGSEPPPAE
jgi:ATP-dependent RNA helicase DeaD